MAKPVLRRAAGKKVEGAKKRVAKDRTSRSESFEINKTLQKKLSASSGPSRKSQNPVEAAASEKGEVQDLKNPRGKKRAREEETHTTEDATTSTKKAAISRPKKLSKKQETKLYSELINPGKRSRKAEEVVADLLKLLAERAQELVDYCSKKIGSRMAQACLKWGSHEQRRSLLALLKEHIPKLAVDRYGHQVVLKLLRYTAQTAKQRTPTPEEKKAQAKSVRDIMDGVMGKHLHSIFYHRCGCSVINGIYFSQSVDAMAKRRILHQVAVPQSVSLLQPDLPSKRPLRKFVNAEELTDEQRDAIREHLRDAVEKAVDKELLAFDVVHVLFQVYCEIASESQLKDLAEKCMAGAPYLLSSKPGAEALIRMLGVVSAKHRKVLLRDLKGKFAALAMNSVDYLVMMRLLATVDDTVLLNKTLVAEWKEDLATICFDKYGHKTLAWMLCPEDAHLFSPYECESMALPAPTAVKASNVRRHEVTSALRPALRTVFLADPLKVAADAHAKDLLSAYLSHEWDAELVQALVKACAEAAKNDDLETLDSGVLTTTLLILLKIEPEKVSGSLAKSLWEVAFKPQLEKVVATRCAFVLMALLKQLGDPVLSVLRSSRAQIEESVKKAKAAEKPVKGAVQLLEEIGKA